jgi:excinuclease UvrABC nuclease subunit
MKGPYRLTELNVKQYVPRMAGAYCLTYSGSDNRNIACYIGRSDNDLKSRLKNHLSPNEVDLCIKRKGADKFYFQETTSAREAYELECEWYHKYNPNCNNIHPDKTYTSWACPVCGR